MFSFQNCKYLFIHVFFFRLHPDLQTAPVIRSLETSTQKSISIAQDFLSLHERKILDEIYEIEKPMFFTTLATIVSVQLEHGWYYLACKKCNKKVHETDDHVAENSAAKKNTTFFCNKCSETLLAQNVTPRLILFSIF